MNPPSPLPGRGLVSSDPVSHMLYQPEDSPDSNNHDTPLTNSSSSSAQPKQLAALVQGLRRSKSIYVKGSGDSPTKQQKQKKNKDKTPVTPPNPNPNPSSTLPLPDSISLKDSSEEVDFFTFLEQHRHTCPVGNNVDSDTGSGKREKKERKKDRKEPKTDPDSPVHMSPKKKSRRELDSIIRTKSGLSGENEDDNYDLTASGSILKKKEKKEDDTDDTNTGSEQHSLRVYNVLYVASFTLN